MIAPDPLDNTLMRLDRAEEENAELRDERDKLRYELDSIANTFGHEYDATLGATLALVRRSIANRAALRSWTCMAGAPACNAFQVVASPRVGETIKCMRCGSTCRIVETDRSFRYEFFDP